MKNLFGITLMFLMGSIVFTGCVGDEELEEAIIVKYEVLTSDGARWTGEFNDEFGERHTTMVLREGMDDKTLPSGWTMEFTPQTQPIELIISASSECPQCTNETQRELSGDLTANIYINGKLVSSNTNSFPGMTLTEPPKGIAATWIIYPDDL